MAWMTAALSPHADDAELGLLSALGPGTRVVLLTGDPERAGEAEEASRLFGHSLTCVVSSAGDDGCLQPRRAVISEVEGMLEGARRVFLPPRDDSHQDHRATAEIAESAVRRSRVEVLEYETVSARPSWTPDTFLPVGEEELLGAIEIVRTAHFSQSSALYFKPDFLLGRAARHGLSIGEPFALAFRTVRRELSLLG